MNYIKFTVRYTIKRQVIRRANTYGKSEDDVEVYKF